MLLEGLPIFAYTLYATHQSMKIDEKAQKKYAKAFEKQVEAENLIKEKGITAEEALKKTANRKKAVLSTSMAEFLDLYEQIIRINFEPGEGIQELNERFLLPARINECKMICQRAASPMSDKELINTFLIKTFIMPTGLMTGLGKTIVADSERTLSMANNQYKTSKVVYAQAETVAVMFDAIIERSNQIATLLAKMNLLFRGVIQESDKLIQKNGTNRANYSKADRRVLMTCINFADAIKKVLDVPLLDKDGAITEASYLAIETGTEYLKKLENL